MHVYTYHRNARVGLDNMQCTGRMVYGRVEGRLSFSFAPCFLFEHGSVRVQYVKNQSKRVRVRVCGNI